MGAILTIVAGFVKLALSVINFLHSTKLIESGKALAAKESLEGVLIRVQQAQAARAKLRDPSERQRLRDKFTKTE